MRILIWLVIVATLTLVGCNDGLPLSRANEKGVSGSTSSSRSPARNGRSANGTYGPERSASTLEGIDSAGRGYRDDVAQLINEDFSGDPAVRSVAIQAARGDQTSILSTTLAMSDTSPFVLQQSQADSCVMHGLTYAQLVSATDAIHAVHARTFNTDARMQARQTFLSKSRRITTLNYDLSKCPDMH